VRGIAAALALLTAPFVAIERAGASCDPPTSANAPVSNTTVTCTGTVTNQNDPKGYGTETETRITINVRPGASVSGSSDGLAFSDGTVNNFGSIVGGTFGAGVFVDNFANVNNAGSISGSDAINVRNSVIVTNSNMITGSNIAIQAGGDVTVTNSVDPNSGSIGKIFGTLFGIDAFGINANATVTNNGGLILGTGANSIGIVATGTATVGNTGDGIFTGIISGSAFGIDAGTVIVTSNTGKIEATAANGVAISAGTATNAGTANVTNNGGVIQATGSNSTAIKAFGDATVTNTVNGTSIGQITGVLFGIDATNVTVDNSGQITSSDTAIHATGTATVRNTGDGISTGIIRAGNFGIDAGTVIVTANTGRIEANAVNGIAISAGGDANITNNGGAIQATTGTGGIAISADTATVSNSGPGIVIGNALAIRARTVNVTGNSGTIEATADRAGSDGIAINGDVVTVTNSGIIRENGIGGRAINANSGVSTATVNNLAGGSIIADGVNGVAIAAGNSATVTNARHHTGCKWLGHPQR
jgi:hypothetical protein